MSDNSLMNPDFLKKELADSIELLAESDKFVQELQVDLDRILDYFIDQDIVPETPDVYQLNALQVKDIVEMLSKITTHKYRMTSPRKVMISHYKQLLEDRRWRIATKLTNLFK